MMMRTSCRLLLCLICLGALACGDKPAEQGDDQTPSQAYRVSQLIPEDLLSDYAQTLRWGQDQALVHVTPGGDCYGLVGSLRGPFDMINPPSGVEHKLKAPVDSFRYSSGVALAWHIAPDGEARILGLTDAPHTSDEHKRFSQILGVNDEGIAFGISWRYTAGRSRPSGSTAWVYDGKATRKAGLQGDLYADTSVPVAVNRRGELIGFTKLKRGGQAAWVYRGGKTTRIGLEGEAYTRNKELFSQPTAINSLGHVVGWSNNSYSNPQVHGWYYDGKQTVRIENPLAKDVPSNRFRPIAVDDAGQVIVLAGSKSSSHTTPVILVKGSEGRVIGKMSHSRTGGFIQRDQAVLAFAHDTGNGGVLIYHDKTPRSFSRTDFPAPYHGRAPLTIGQLLDNGVAIGPTREEARQWRGRLRGERPEREAPTHGEPEPDGCGWLWDGKRLHPLLLPKDQTTTTRGCNTNLPVAVNRKAMVAGVSFSIDSFDRSQSAWLYDGKKMHRIGYTDEAHSFKITHVDVDAGGGKSQRFWQDSTALFINETGQVVGRSARPTASGSRGKYDERDASWTTWLYDHRTGETHELFAASKQGNYPGGRATYLSDQGTVLGWVDAGSRGGGDGFVWTLDTGLIKLDADVVAGLADQGWDSLHKPCRIFNDGTIIGYGAVVNEKTSKRRIKREKLFRLEKASG